MKNKFTMLFIAGFLIFPISVFAQCDYSYGKWDTALSKMPVERVLFSAVTYNDSIYILGGCLIDNEGTREYISSVDIYVPSSDTWITGISELPFTRLCTYACLLGNKIYVIGGARIISGDPVTYDSLNIYNIQTNTWEKGKSLPAKRCYFGADTINGKIYVTGGLTDNWSVVNSLYEYDPVRDEWTEKAPMTTTRYGTCAKSWNGRLYVSGGISGTWAVLNSIEIYDPVSDQWTVRTGVAEPRASMDISTVGDFLFAFAGFQAFAGSGYIYTDIISRYDPSIDSWLDFTQQGDKIPDTRLFPASVFVNDRIYLFGGLKDGVTFDNVWSYKLKSIRQTKKFNDTVIGSEPLEINLSEYFSTTLDEAMNFSICPGYKDEVIQASIENTILTIEKSDQGSGSTQIALNISNSKDTVSSNTFTLELQTGIPNSARGHFYIFPNQVSEVACINLNDMESGTARLEIYSSTGQLVQAFIIEPGLKHFEWSVTGYGNGLYFAVLRTDNFTSAAKLLIQH